MSGQISSDLHEKGRRAVELLQEVRQILVLEGERDWIRGISAALLELRDEDGGIKPEGFDRAASIYRSMTTGGRGFAEYFIWSPDSAERISRNKELDAFRDSLWDIFKDR